MNYYTETNLLSQRQNIVCVRVEQIMSLHTNRLIADTVRNGVTGGKLEQIRIWGNNMLTCFAKRGQCSQLSLPITGQREVLKYTYTRLWPSNIPKGLDYYIYDIRKSTSHLTGYSSRM